jgi:murein L,D-transpeptidase YafK
MKLVRQSVLVATAVSALALAGCNDESAMPRSGRHYVPVSFAVQNEMREKNMRSHAPILIRAFKQESELEVWKQDSSGKMALLKTFPMCRWSGQLGPKVKEGDRQVPEGFYNVTPGAMNPNSSYYLSFNVGYPNNFDRQLGRSGAHIMVHGDCSSMGCFAMTDGQVADIYALTREAFAGGQTQVQMQSYPFRMTPENLAKYRNDPHIGFWKNLKQGNDHFEVTQKPVQTAACNGRYGFGGETCEGEADSEIRSAVAAKQRQDENKVAELVSRGTRAVKRLYRDGDMHPTFKETLLAGNTRAVGTTRNGISRQDQVAFTPVELPVDQYKSHKSKGRSSMQIAELAQQEQVNAAMAGADAAKPAETAKVEPAKTETAKTEPAKVEPARATPARAAGATSIASTPAAATQPAAATALTAAPIEAPQKSAFQRLMGTVGLGSAEAPAPEAAKVEEIAPQRVNVPLPPRRQAQSAPAPGPQATAPASKLPELVGSSERLAPSSLASGFSKLQ